MDEKEAEESAAAASNANADNDMVRWRGNSVSKEEAKALHHVFDEMKDHFGQTDPMVRVNEVSLVHPGNNSPVWRGDLNFTYKIEGEQYNLGFVGMDICLDLTPKLLQKDDEFINYGKNWVFVYLLKETRYKFKQYVKVGAGWDVIPEGTVEDDEKDLVAIKARLNNENGQVKPSFWVSKDKDAPKENIRSFSRIGTVQEMNDNSEQQRVHRGIGIFSVSMEVEGTSDSQPTPGMRKEGNLSFTLVSFRSCYTTDYVAPIVYVPSNSCKEVVGV